LTCLNNYLIVSLVTLLKRTTPWDGKSYIRCINWISICFFCLCWIETSENSTRNSHGPKKRY